MEGIEDSRDGRKEGRKKDGRKWKGRKDGARRIGRMKERKEDRKYLYVLLEKGGYAEI